jgi:putative inorganic carbon (HCO3(-)) transporter
MASLRGLPAGVLRGERRPLWPRAPELPEVVGYLILIGAAVLMGVAAGYNAKYALAGAFGLAFVAVVMVDVTLGLCAFTFLSFLELLLVTDDKSFSFLKVAGFLLMISWLARISTRRDKSESFISEHPQFIFILVGFLAWAVLSASWAEVPKQALDTSSRYFQNMILFLIVYTAIRERKHAIWVAWAWLLGATVATVPAMLNPPTYEDDLTVRISGTIGDPNELAALLVAGVVFAGVLTAVTRDRPPLRLAAGGAVILFVLGIFYTVSRGGLLALGVALIAACILAGRWRGRTLVVAGLGLSIVVIYFASFAGLDARDRVTTVQGGTGRSDLWKIGWRMFEDKPIRGIGSGNFPISSIHYLVQPGVVERDDFIIDTPKVTHNTYLQILSELGIVGLALFLTIVGFAISTALKAARWFGRNGDTQMELVARGTIVALVGILTADFFISEMYGKQLWLMMGLGPALYGVARRSYPKEKTQPQEQPEPDLTRILRPVPVGR